MTESDRPEPGVQYSLTSFGDDSPSIAKGNTWAESKVRGCDDFTAPAGSASGPGFGQVVCRNCGVYSAQHDWSDSGSATIPLAIGLGSVPFALFAAHVVGMVV